VLGIDPDLCAILTLGALWLGGLFLLLRFTRRPDPEREHYADKRTNPD